MEKSDSEITAEETKKSNWNEKELAKNFKQVQKKEIVYEEIKQRIFESVTSAIGKVEGKIDEVLSKNLLDLVPVVYKFANI